MMGASSLPYILLIIIACNLVLTVFALITLPVEFDVSKRALLWLSTNRDVMYTKDENKKAKDALWWAAMTYVIAALGALANLIYYTSMLFGRGKG